MKIWAESGSDAVYEFEKGLSAGRKLRCRAWGGFVVVEI
jgi:hypothetical protein